MKNDVPELTNLIYINLGQIRLRKPIECPINA